MRIKLSYPTLRRLPRYLRQAETLLSEARTHVSSKELAESLGFTPSQVRQDFAALKEVCGVAADGLQGYGYRVDSLKANMERILKLTEQKICVLVGVGNLALALAHNFDFIRCGIRLDAAFDVLPEKIGTILRTLEGEVLIRDVAELPDYCALQRPRAAILTCPPDVAQDTADILTLSGVQGIWNLTNVDIRVPEGVALENVHLSDSLMTLSCRIDV